MGYEAIRVDRRDHIWELTLCRPQLLNRFDSVLHEEFIQVLDEIRTADARVVILASEGKAFSAGGDFEFIRAAHSDHMRRRSTMDGARRLIGTLIDLPQPVVAAVQGPAIGLGATVALACDTIVAARSAAIADSHVTIGLVAGDGGCLVWPTAVGMPRARRHLLTGDPLEAETAYMLGLVTDLVDTPEQTLVTARHVADKIAALPPLAVQGTKRALNRVTQQRAGEVIDLSTALEEATLSSNDVLEGIASFQEKRQGRYTGT